MSLIKNGQYLVGRFFCLKIVEMPINSDAFQETGNRKQETGNRKQETGNRKQETGKKGLSANQPL